jgi:hypothetical protein
MGACMVKIRSCVVDSRKVGCGDHMQIVDK